MSDVNVAFLVGALCGSIATLIGTWLGGRRR